MTWCKEKSLISRLGWCLCMRDEKGPFRVEMVSGNFSGVLQFAFCFKMERQEVLQIMFKALFAINILNPETYFTLLILNV